MPKPAPTHALTFKVDLAAPPAEAYRAFTHATALRDWLCNAAQTDPRPGGRLYLWWSSGYYTSGKFTAAVPGKKLAFTWHGRGELTETRVQITFKAAKSGGTRLSLSHTGLGQGPKWTAIIDEFDDGWRAGLENLQSMLDSGVDLRQARRPRLGIGIDDFNPAIAAELGVPAKAGVRLAGAAPGSGAEAAGLTKDDVLVKLAGQAVRDYPSLGAVLEKHTAGDQLPVVYYRGAQRLKATVTLGAFPMPDLPTTPADLAAQARALYAERDRQLAKALAGVSEVQSDFHPAPHEWNLKELLAHFIATERDLQAWVADLLRDNVSGDSLEYRPNMTPRLAAITARYGTLAALRKELKLASAETAVLLASLPPEFVARRHLFRRVAEWATQITLTHWTEEHQAQLQATLQAAQKK